MAQVTVNLEIITRFEHAFRAGDQATIDELCDPGLADHNPVARRRADAVRLQAEGRGLQGDASPT